MTSCSVKSNISETYPDGVGQGKLQTEPTRMGHLKGAPHLGRFLALAVNIRLCWKARLLGVFFLLYFVGDKEKCFYETDTCG
jgi:hypothetical protein